MKRADPYGDKFKEYESRKDYALPRESLWMMRLDGNNFSKLTKKIHAEKPFDSEFAEAMRLTTVALVEKFGFATGYVQSDEISLVPPRYTEGNALWNLRIQKLCSVIASFAAVKFYQLLSARLDGTIPTFDARVFCVEKPWEYLSALRWRQDDCLKNAKNLVGQEFFTNKELHGIPADEQIRLVESLKGVSFFSYPAGFRYGYLIKRIQVLVDAKNPQGEDVKVLRTRYISVSRKLEATDLDFVIEKYTKGNYDS